MFISLFLLNVTQMVIECYGYVENNTEEVPGIAFLYEVK